jgi:hypothetical protein
MGIGLRVWGCGFCEIEGGEHAIDGRRGAKELGDI